MPGITKYVKGFSVKVNGQDIGAIKGIQPVYSDEYDDISTIQPSGDSYLEPEISGEVMLAYDDFEGLADAFLELEKKVKEQEEEISELECEVATMMEGI